MELKEVYEKLKTLKIPTAYRFFKRAPESVPFVVYYFASSSRYGADYLNLLDRRTIVIELYTEIKNEILENKLYKLFEDYDIDIDENYIDSEKLYMITVTIEDLKKI